MLMIESRKGRDLVLVEIVEKAFSVSVRLSSVLAGCVMD